MPGFYTVPECIVVMIPANRMQSAAYAAGTYQAHLSSKYINEAGQLVNIGARNHLPARVIRGSVPTAALSRPRRLSACGAEFITYKITAIFTHSFLPEKTGATNRALNQRDDRCQPLAPLSPIEGNYDVKSTFNKIVGFSSGWYGYLLCLYARGKPVAGVK